MPLTPGLFSTTTGWPMVSDILAAKARPIWSVALPAANGTMALIGLVGYDWAMATEPTDARAAKSVMKREAGRM